MKKQSGFTLIELMIG
ncbi:prepilin-type N-terminal cleavage/methylation domain-containing protein [Aeromonas media]